MGAKAPILKALCVKLSMDTLAKVKSLTAILEALISFLFSVGALWSISGLWTCPLRTPDCEAWAILGALVLAPIGVLLGVASGVLAKTRSWYSQLAVLPALAWLMYWGLYA
jgi:hypothetical protein